MSRPSRRSLQFQFQETYQGMICFGQSRHEAKEKRRQAGEKNIGATEGIYSINTLETYTKASKVFVKWVKLEHGCRTMDDARQYVPEYLEYRISRELSPWTINRDCAALSKAYGCSMKDWGVERPRRTKDVISRSRHEVEMDKHFNPDSHAELMSFLLSTGPRRFEAEKIKLEDVSPDYRTVHIRGKGGKHRYVTILPEYVDNIKAVVEKAEMEGRTKLFGKISENLDIHAIRREFAQNYYKYLVEHGMTEYHGTKSPIYYCRGKDKGKWLYRGALLLVSKQLGHSREDVVAINYLT